MTSPGDNFKQRMKQTESMDLFFLEKIETTDVTVKNYKQHDTQELTAIRYCS